MNDVGKECATDSLVRDIFEALDKTGAPWCVLNGYGRSGVRPESDVDVLTLMEPVDILREVVRELRPRGVRLVQIHEDEGLYCVFVRNDAELTSIAVDITQVHAPGGHLVRDTAEILENRQREKDFWKPAPADAFVCYLYKRLWKGYLSVDQARWLQDRAVEAGQTLIPVMSKIMGRREAIRVAEAFSSWTPEALSSRFRELVVVLRQRGGLWKELLDARGKVRRIWRRLMGPPGVILCLEGSEILPIKDLGRLFAHVRVRRPGWLRQAVLNSGRFGVALNAVVSWVTLARSALIVWDSREDVSRKVKTTGPRAVGVAAIVQALPLRLVVDSIEGKAGEKGVVSGAVVDAILERMESVIRLRWML